MADRLIFYQTKNPPHRNLSLPRFVLPFFTTEAFAHRTVLGISAIYKHELQEVFALVILQQVE